MKHIFLFFLLIISTGLFAQSVELGLSELAEKGISEQDFRDAMLAKGYDIDNIKPEQTAELQPIIEETVQELEQKKVIETKEKDKKETSSNDTKLSPEPSKEIIKEIEEADIKKENLENTIYGHHLFLNNSIVLFENAKGVKPPKNYILGVGDEISVSIFGASQADFKYTIDDEGAIRPTGLSKVFIKGNTVPQAEKILRAKFAQAYVFSPEQFSVSLLTTRNILVSVLGEVNQPGTFSVSAANSAINLLMLAKGLTKDGGVRSIKVISGSSVKELDLYEYINNPSIVDNFYLSDNDMIVVPLAQKVVDLEGAVKRPYKYELKPNENLKALFNYAGGFQANAKRDILQINRYEGNDRVFIDLDHTKLGLTDYNLFDGDQIIVKSITVADDVSVNIEGPLFYPGEFGWRKGLMLSEIIKKAKVQPVADLDNAFIMRKNQFGNYKLEAFEPNAIIVGTKDLELFAGDKIVMYTADKFTKNGLIFITGAVRQQDTLVFDPTTSITLLEAISYCGGLKDDAEDYAYIFRERIDNPKEREYILANLNLKDYKKGNDYLLQANDIVKVFSKSEYYDERYVSVLGAVYNPKKIEYNPSLTMGTAIILAGGLKENASTNRIEVSRLIIKNNEPTRVITESLSINDLSDLENSNYSLFPYDQIVVRSIPDFDTIQNVVLMGEVKYPGSYALQKDNERLMDIVKRAGGFTPEALTDGLRLIRIDDKIGNVVTNMDNVLKNENSIFNYILFPNDTIIVPKHKDLVSIIMRGTQARAIYSDSILTDNSIDVAFNKGKRAKWYIKEYAGGYANNAKRSETRVVQSSGELARSTKLFFFSLTPRVSPGAKINVGVKPEKKEEINGEKNKVDWEKILTGTTAAVTSILTIILLTQRID